MNLKHILLFGIFIAFFSCSTDSTDNPDEETDDSTLLKQTIETDSEGEVYTTNFTYDGNKLISVISDGGYKNIYTYENDNLVREDQYIEGELVAYVILEYNSEGKVSIYTESFLEASGLSPRKYKHIFTYNDGGTITNEVYTSYSDSEFELDWTEIITLDGKNIIKVDSSDDTISYTYDNKNGAFKNIHAIEVLNLLAENEFGSLIYGNTNNATSIKYEYSSYVNIETNEFSYNDNNYPKKSIYKDFYDGSIQYETTIEYFYE
ncbi:MAG TPA: hypothetical protein VF985_09600 [Mariniflexile sp.]